MIAQVFGDMLYFPHEDPLTEFPSPESLKGRILISTKPPKEYLESKQFKDSDSERESNEEGSLSPCIIPELEVVDEKVSIKNIFVSNSICIYKLCVLMSSPHPTGQSNGNDLDEEGLSARDKKSDQQSAPEYKRLITINAGKPKGHVKDHLNNVGGVKRLSLSEHELEKASATYGSDIVRYPTQ